MVGFCYRENSDGGKMLMEKENVSIIVYNGEQLGYFMYNFISSQNMNLNMYIHLFSLQVRFS